VREPRPTPSLSLSRARAAAGRALGALAREPTAIRLCVAGDLRRMAPRVEGVTLLASSPTPGALLEAFLALPWMHGARHPDLDVAFGQDEDGLPLALRVVAEDEALFAAQWLYLTARTDHFAALLRAADARGLLLDPRGLWRGEARVEAQSEAAIYERLGLPWLPPEVREGNTLVAPPEDLVAMADVRGLGHVHTTRGRGRHDLTQMAARARREGYAWLLLADAAQDAEAAAAQRSERAAIERLADEEGTPLHILGPAEAGFASCASDPAATIEALSHPGVKVLAHPCPNDGAGWITDLAAWSPVLDACAEHAVVLEVSGGPAALPLPVGWHEAAQTRGLRALAAADAHDLAGVDDQICAVGLLRRGRWRRTDVVSTRVVSQGIFD